MEIFDSVVAVFNFIGDLLQTIIEGITGIGIIFTHIFNLLFSIITILPTQLYLITYTFLGIFSILYVYKLFRKG